MPIVYGIDGFPNELGQVKSKNNQFLSLIIFSPRFKSWARKRILNYYFGKFILGHICPFLNFFSFIQINLVRLNISLSQEHLYFAHDLNRGLEKEY